MKTKFLFLAVAAFTAMIFAGCGNNSPSSANPPSGQQTPAPGATNNLNNTNAPASTNQ